MNITAGIIGLPNVGKSTLFNAITKQKILAANYPFATIEPNVGIVTVNDYRMKVLVDMYHPKSIVPTAYEFTDIAGIVKGASKGEGLGNKFLSHIREVDAIVEVVRCFDGEGVINTEDTVDPLRDAEIIDIELALSDMEILSKRVARLGKKASMTKDKDELFEVETLEKGLKALEEGIALRKIDLNEDEKKLLKSFGLISLKPIIYVANVSEDDLFKEDNDYVKALKAYAEKEHSFAIKLAAKTEEDLSDLSDEEKKSFLESMGMEESGLDKLVRATYQLLNLKTFFTVGVEEVRAWTFKEGSLAPEAAGIIHTDFQKGFIKAEVMSYDDLVKYGSEQKVKEAGRLRLEGKNYVMEDGDIVYFRFNVTK